MKKFGIVAAFAAAATLGLAAMSAQAQTVRDAATYDIVSETQHPSDLRTADARELAQLTQLSDHGYSNDAVDGGISIPYGDMIADFLTWLLMLAGAVAAWVMRRLPSAAVSALDMLAGALGQGRANELLEKAITYGVNTTAGAVRGKTLSVKVGNEVLERALEYAVRHAPSLVTKLGGIQSIREKIIARLDLEADAAIPAPRPPAESLIRADSAAPAPTPAPAQ